MTEEEAKTKWCPMVRSLIHNGLGTCAANQTYSNETIDIKLAHCKGSQCMMWKEAAPYADIKPRGYCGLSGQDE